MVILVVAALSVLGLVLVGGIALVLSVVFGVLRDLLVFAVSVLMFGIKVIRCLVLTVIGRQPD